MAHVSSREAAMLLSLHNPRTADFDDVKHYNLPGLSNGHLVHLDRRLSDFAGQVPGVRSLLDWYRMTQDLRIKLAPEADSFMEYVATQLTATHEPVVSYASNAPAWKVNPPLRYGGYSLPLYRLLVAANQEGKPRPTARDVLEAWRIDAPAEIAKMLMDGFDYYDANGNTNTAGIDAIRKAIGRMTKAL